MPISAPTKTVQDVLDSVKRLFGDESGAQITDADIIRWINSGQRDINNRFRLVKGIATIATTVSLRTYTFPEIKVLSIDSLHYDGRPLAYRNFQEAKDYIIEEDPNFIQTGTPILWYEWGNELYVYPSPDSVKSLSLYYIGYYDDVGSPGDLLGIPDSYFDALILYIMQQAYELDDDLAASANKASQYDAGLNILSEDAQGSRRATYPVITLIDEDY